MKLYRLIFSISSLFILTSCGHNVDPQLKELVKCIAAAEKIGDINSALIAKDSTLTAALSKMAREGKTISQSDLVDTFKEAISELDSNNAIKKIYYSNYCKDVYSTSMLPR
ncbi:hypothetical protein ACWIVU_08060 [Ursidibacter arcticus]|uniref:hypothetical protein n=1 Tax=Ursidibacter arcticus TaxID=1524965 RepID=UPI0012F7B5D7|nr:hypothetical protein [Ursidibacter arcticus]KAE9537780.1 hypothetical protein A1D25_09950 [Ursidibacter arcticus]